MDRSDRRRRYRGDASTIVARLVAIRRYADRLQAPGAPDRGAAGRAPGRPTRELDVAADGSNDAADPRPASDGGEPRFTVRETDRGFIVVADLEGVVRNDYETEIGLNDDSLVLTVDNRFAWRVPVDDGTDESSITEVSLNNDVLEARVYVD